MKVVDKVTLCLIYNIISNRLKPGKTDVDADITTDCLNKKQAVAATARLGLFGLRLEVPHNDR